MTGALYYKVSQLRGQRLVKVSWYAEVSEKQSIQCLHCHDEVKPVVNQPEENRPVRIFSAKKRPGSGVKKKDVRVSSVLPMQQMSKKRNFEH